MLQHYIFDHSLAAYVSQSAFLAFRFFKKGQYHSITILRKLFEVWLARIFMPDYTYLVENFLVMIIYFLVNILKERWNLIQFGAEVELVAI